MFARIRPSNTHNMLVLTVLKAQPTDAEFDECLRLTYEAYVTMPPQFVMIFDLCRMTTLDIQRCKQWMSLFVRVKEVTRQNLVCTCIAYDGAMLRLAVEMFLRFYDPIKPFHVFSSREQCLAFARSRATPIRECAVSASSKEQGSGSERVITN